MHHSNSRELETFLAVRSHTTSKYSQVRGSISVNSTTFSLFCFLSAAVGDCAFDTSIRCQPKKEWNCDNSFCKSSRKKRRRESLHPCPRRRKVEHSISARTSLMYIVHPPSILSLSLSIYLSLYLSIYLSLSLSGVTVNSFRLDNPQDAHFCCGLR